MRRLWVLGVALLVVAGCGPAAPPAPPAPRAKAVGSPSGTLIEKTIGAAGGSLASADGLLTIEVPAGALAADTKVGIQPLSNTAPGGLGAAFRLSPKGTTFGAPVTLSFRPSAARLAGTTLSLTGIAWQDAAGIWRWTRQVERDEGAGRVRVGTTRFSDWSLVAGAQLRPPSASVQTGQTLTLTAVNCYTADPDDGLAPLYDCADKELAPIPLALSNWAVNATPGGNDVVGTVSAGQQMTATFKAPAKRPDPHVVAVSVDASKVKLDGRTFARVTLVSNVAIGGYTTFRGSFDLAWQQVIGEVTDRFNATGTVEFGRSVKTSFGRRYSLIAANSTNQVSNLRHSTSTNTCTANPGSVSFGVTSLSLRDTPASGHELKLGLVGYLPSTTCANGLSYQLGTSSAVGNGAPGECMAAKFVPSAPDAPVLSGTASWNCSLSASHRITATLSWKLAGS